MTFKLLRAAFVKAGEIWGFILEPARTTAVCSEYIINSHNRVYSYTEYIYTPVCGVIVVFHIKPFLLPNDIRSTPSVLPDSSF